MSTDKRFSGNDEDCFGEGQKCLENIKTEGGFMSSTIPECGTIDACSGENFSKSSSVDTSTQVSPVAVFSIAIVMTLLLSGTIFGYAPLKEMLEDMGVFKSECQASKMVGNTCNAQDNLLNAGFSIGLGVNLISGLPSGFMLDRYGARVAGLSCTAMCLIGFLFLAFTSSVNFFFLPAYFFLGFGGGLFLAVVNIVEKYPLYTGLLFALLMGAFALSSSIFLIFKELYFNYEVSLQTMSLICTGLALLGFFALSYLLSPKRLGVKKTPKDVEDVMFEEDSEDSLTEASSVDGAAAFPTTLHNLSLKEKLLSWQYYGFIFASVFAFVGINLFLSATKHQLESNPAVNSENTQQLLDVFYYLLPFGGLVDIPLAYLLLDRMGLIFSLVAIMCSFVVMLTLMLTPWYSGLYIVITIMCCTRTTVCSFGPTYISKMFGYKDFGVLFGTAQAVIGSMSLLEYLVSYLVNEYLDHDYTIVFGVQLACACVFSAFPIKLYIWAQHEKLLAANVRGSLNDTEVEVLDTTEEGPMEKSTSA
eukprot:Nk52_evm7s2391 gene=Nk52_evmTU7s2391